MEEQSLEYYLKNQPAEIECPHCIGMAFQIGQSSTGNESGWMAVTVYFCRNCNNASFSTVGVSTDGV